MKRLKNLSESSTSPFIRVLFGHSSPAPVPSDLKALDQTVGEISWNSESLNDSQKDAVRFALASKEIALIHGPPGTGKTHTLIELILQLLKKGSHILVCGPSNISVDNIVERLAPYKVPMVRLGHPARLLPSVLDHSLEVLTKTSEAAALVRDIRKEMDDKQASIRKTRSGKERREVYGEIKELRRDYRERERGCVDSLVQGSKVVLSTLHGAGSFQLRQTQFDVVIIDEASQALEAQCWVALLSAKKAVLAGDHLQLPPTIKSLNSKAHTSSAENKKSSASEGLQPSKDGEGKPRITKEDGEGKRLDKQIPGSLEVTLFDRLLTLHGPSIKRMLTTQYRMHSSIMSFPSSALYEDKLIAAPSVSARLLCQLKYNTPVQETEDTTVPLVFYDTQGGDFPEKSEDVLEQGNQKRKVKSTSSLGESKSNELEAALVSRHVGNLVEAGICADEIAVIAPYNAQVALIGTMLKEKFASIELGSVDGFQGREKEAVVVSLVRSNAEREVGFLSERRRLNGGCFHIDWKVSLLMHADLAVAMTRPRRHLCVIGDSETVGR